MRVSDHRLVFGIFCALGASALAAGAGPLANAASLSTRFVAPAEIQAAFAASESDQDQGLVTLQKSAFGKAYLMTPSIVVAGMAPMVQHLQPKVVVFEENGSQVALFEQNTYAIYGGLPGSKLIQSFPIVRETETEVTFDPEFGFTAISLKDGQGASDQPGSLYAQVSDADPVIPTVSSYIQSVSFDGNALQLVQASRLRMSGFNLLGAIFNMGQVVEDTEDLTVFLTTRIAPYQPNPHFQPRLSTLQRGVGYFETPVVRKRDGGLDVYADRWDISPEAGPITYAISREVPPELVDAVKEGILYWNRVLGRDVLRVETDADPNEAPRYRRAIVQWIPYDSAGFSMASLQADPLTGEILSATVYMTSAWNLYARQQITRALEATRAAAQAKSAPRFVLGPSGFSSGLLCEMDSTRLAPTLDQIESLGSGKPELLKKAAKDLVRNVVAHEVGHTLGLRHNFAGSLATELPKAADDEKAWTAYLSDPENEGAAVSSSVMDYQTPADDLLLGAAIRDHVLDYDKAAITWGYSDRPVDVQALNPPIFCTDGEMYSNGLLGCAAFDSGNDPIESYAVSVSRAKSQLADLIVDGLLEQIRPKYAQDRRTIHQAAAALDPDVLGVMATRDAVSSYALLTEGAGSLALLRELDGVNWMTREEVKKRTPLELAKAFSTAGGLPGWLRIAFGLAPEAKLQAPKPGWITDAIRARVESSRFASGQTLDGVDYQLSPSEMSELEKYALLIGQKTESAYLRDLLVAMTGVDPEGSLLAERSTGILSTVVNFMNKQKYYLKEVTDPAWQKDLAELAIQVITARSDQKVSGMRNGKPISLPKAEYSASVRQAAANLLSDEVFSRDGWLSAAQAQISDKLTQAVQLVAIKKKPSFIARLFGADDTYTIDGLKLSDEVKKWTQDEISVLASVNSADEGNSLFKLILGGGLFGKSAAELGITSQQLEKAAFGGSRSSK